MKISYYTQRVINYYIEHCHFLDFEDETDNPLPNFESMSQKKLKDFVNDFLDEKEYRSLQDWFKENGYQEEANLLEKFSFDYEDENEEVLSQEALDFFSEWDFHVYSQAQLAFHLELSKKIK